MPKSKMSTLYHNITRNMDTIQNLLERFFIQSAKLLIPSIVYSRCGHDVRDFIWEAKSRQTFSDMHQEWAQKSFIWVEGCLSVSVRPFGHATGLGLFISILKCGFLKKSFIMNDFLRNPHFLLFKILSMYNFANRTTQWK